MTRVQFLAGAAIFSPCYLIQTGSGVHPVSYPMGTRGSFPGDGGVRWPACEACHLPPSSAEVKNHAEAHMQYIPCT
jgi:hypothetical protein